MKTKILSLFLSLMLILCGCMAKPTIKNTNEISVSEYIGSPYEVINGNVPYFNEADYTVNSFEHYSPLDYLGRCTEAVACIGTDIMPTEERGAIGAVKPTGWQYAKYDFVEGKYLFNRCHLLGFQLTGENANECNLITGTRYMNVEGMLPFENMVADYVKTTGNHVLLRVTPVFEGENLVASGVTMEGYSVEDSGRGICFNVYCYNVQPGVIIDYATGTSYAEKNEGTKQEGTEGDYVLNIKSKKIHVPDCTGVHDMNSKNKKEYHGTVTELKKQGYTPCGICNPA